jgi:DNA-binding transcriptional regulator LsrR (DeoR family)
MTAQKAAEIRRAYFSREAKQAELARRYGIKQNTVSRIVSGITWGTHEHLSAGQETRRKRA